MNVTVILLFCLSLCLFLVSFFRKDPYKELKEEIEQLTIKHVQDVYQMKQRLRILEEELLISEEPFNSKSTSGINEIIKNQIFALARQGKSIDQISKQSSLPLEDVCSVLEEGSDKK